MSLPEAGIGWEKTFLRASEASPLTGERAGVRGKDKKGNFYTIKLWIQREGKHRQAQGRGKLQ